MASSFLYGNNLYFTQDVLWERLDRHAGTRGLPGEVFLIHRIECAEICHLRQETGRLDDVLIAAVGCFEDLADVFHHLFRLYGTIGIWTEANTIPLTTLAWE